MTWQRYQNIGKNNNRNVNDELTIHSIPSHIVSVILMAMTFSLNEPNYMEYLSLLICFECHYFALRRKKKKSHDIITNVNSWYYEWKYTHFFFRRRWRASILWILYNRTLIYHSTYVYIYDRRSSNMYPATEACNMI